MRRIKLANLKRDDRGAALIELAIITPLLVILLLGIIELGWILNGYVNLTGAAREGARVYVVGGDYQTAATEHVSTLSALEISSVNGSIDSDAITVRVSGNLSLLLGDELAMEAKATMRSE